MDNTENEENLSDASLIEDDEEEDQEQVETQMPLPMETAEVRDDEMVIDLPGRAIVSEAPSEADEDTAEEGDNDTMEDDGENSDAEEPFCGFTDEEIAVKKSPIPPLRSAQSVDTEDLNLSKPFSSQADNNWSYSSPLPPFKVTPRKAATPIKHKALPQILQQPSEMTDERKVKPLKIKKPPPMLTPSPIMRESREWRPSAQFFKPLDAGWVREVVYERNDDGSYCAKPKGIVYHAPIMPGTKAKSFKSLAELSPYLAGKNVSLTLHNFSFRNEPMNAPKEQEICHAVDELVQIFPPPPPPPPKKEPAPKVATPERKKSVDEKKDDSKTPNLPGGLLKVKMFGKMKERNAFDSPGSEGVTSPGAAAPTPVVGDQDHEMEVEDFELEPQISIKPIKPSPPKANGTQSLGNSGVTITPISKGSKRKDGGNSIHMPGGGFETALKENNKPFSLGGHGGSTTITTAASSMAATASKIKSLPSVTLTPTGSSAKGGSSKKRPAPHGGKNAVTPLRPIEAQSVVNIAGMKYLVVPHPEPAVKCAKVDKNQTGNNRLPIVLKPQQGNEESPSFEVEETADGKLILLPMGPGKHTFKKTPAASTASSSLNISTLSAGFSGLIQVFRYLNMQERLKASQVCKLWNQAARHPSLWTNIMLKNVKVHDWKCLRDQMNRVGTQRLDLRKLLFVKSEEESWNEVANVLLAASTTLTAIDLPKINPGSLHKIVHAAASSSITDLKTIKASSITFDKDKPELVDIGAFAELASLEDLKLKSVSGSLNIDNFSESLKSLISQKKSTLKRLALLSLKCLTLDDLKNITELTNLEHLELGNCSQIKAADIFEVLSSMTNLRSLRLERGKMNESIGALATLPNLEQLELIDFELVQDFSSGFVKLQNVKKLLLIPVYKDEVGAINAELVDAMLSMNNMLQFYLGLTSEWLDSISGVLSKEKSTKDSFPIVVNGVIEMYTLSKLYKTLMLAMPNAKKVKILKMPKSATTKTNIANRK